MKLLRNAGATNLVQYFLRFSEIYIFLFMILFSGFRYQAAAQDISGVLFVFIAIFTIPWLVYLMFKKARLYIPPRPGVYISLGLTVLTSMFHSVNVYVSAREVALWFIAAVIFLFIYNIIIYGYPKRHLINAALITGAVFIALKVYQAVDLYLNRTSTCSNLIVLQNKSAAFAGMILFLSLAVAIERSGRGKIFPYILAVFSAIIALLTGSRGGLIAIAAAAIVFIAVSELSGRTAIYKNKLYTIGLLALIILLPIAAIKILRPLECTSLVDPDGVSFPNPAWGSNITTRADCWKLAGEITSEYPAFGSGPGTFQILAVPIFKGTGHAAHAHNIYLQALAERGFIGFYGSMALILVMLTYIGVMQPDPPLAAAGVAVLVAYCVHGLVDVVAIEPFIMRYLAVILALALSPGKENIQNAENY